MTADQIIDRIHGSYQTGSKRGLENTRALLSALGWRGETPFVHVAGTNGKGSVCAMTESVLHEAGYHTGLYTSPFLQRYQERIRLDGRPVGDDLLIPCGMRVLDAAERLKADGIFCTPFELGTALALTVFEAARTDIAVIETGMGGRLDPTNVITPAVCAVTAVGMDHMRYLGDTLEAIAGEKAGILKPGVPAVLQPAEESTAAVIRSRALEAGAPLCELNRSSLADFAVGPHSSTASFRLRRAWDGLQIGLPGAHQLMNAMTALSVIEHLQEQGWDIPEAAVRAGMARVRWPARLEWFGSVLLDGAHNAQGMEALAAFVQACLQDRPRVTLCGILEEKVSPALLDSLASVAGRAVCVTPDSPRALGAETLAALLRRRGCAAEAAGSPAEALEAARRLAGPDGVVIAAGSLYLMGELRTLLAAE